MAQLVVDILIHHVNRSTSHWKHHDRKICLCCNRLGRSAGLQQSGEQNRGNSWVLLMAWNPAQQLSLVVYPIFVQGFIYLRWWLSDFRTINSKTPWWKKILLGKDLWRFPKFEMLFGCYLFLLFRSVEKWAQEKKIGSAGEMQFPQKIFLLYSSSWYLCSFFLFGMVIFQVKTRCENLQGWLSWTPILCMGDSWKGNARQSWFLSFYSGRWFNSLSTKRESIFLHSLTSLKPFFQNHSNLSSER